MTNDNETKELFYHSLDSLLSETPVADKLILLGDFNARVGKEHETWPQALGKFGKGKMNSNGELLLTKCSEHDLAITNTFFNYSDKWYHSWKHLRSKHPTLLDYIITRMCDLKDFCSTRAMRGAECTTDHFMIRSKCHIKPKPPSMKKKRSKPPKKMNVKKLKEQSVKDQLVTAINDNLQTLLTGTSDKQWRALKNAVFSAASDVLGKPTRKQTDWFDESNEEIMELVNEKNSLFHRTLDNRCTRGTRNKYKDVKSELQKKLRQMKNDCVLHADGIPPEVWTYGGPALRNQLLQLFCNIWSTTAEVSQDFKDATIYKRKGDRAECGNHRGISPLSVAGKILAKILQFRLQTLAKDILPESQCGFIANRSTQDMIFTLRQLQEKCAEQRQPLIVTFVDFSKAFDTVHRETLWKLLSRYGCPETFIRVLRSFHDGMSANICCGDGCSDSFSVGYGVKQGCVLASTLFTIFLAAVLKSMPEELGDISIRTRGEGDLFNLRRLKAKSKTREKLIRKLLFADDSALVTHSLQAMQASKRFGLTINTKKTEVLIQDTKTQSLTLVKCS
ncbi:uncharacterized protein LOC135684641 [Rhopilema esculentum]|uniref:uncharacterized protein LOC135684641 n=1 Tax=Rhopilema esculentum TaxID=499914 RepID=UPI0031DB8AB8|eukprot:gene16389-7792_t